MTKAPAFRWLCAAIIAAIWGYGPAVALTLDLPASANLEAQDARAEDRLLVPTGPRAGSGGPGLVAEGRVTRRAWTVPGAGLTPFQLIEPLEEQLEAMGFTPHYACRDRDCGGFDFRLALDLIAAPAMHVDLGDFRYYAASRDGPQGAEVVSLVTSRSAGAGHIHLTLVSPSEAPDGFTARSVGPPPAQGTTETGLAALLDTEGQAVLDGLVFRPGSSQLGDGPFGALAALAEWLAADPTRTVVLVGHSDNVGSLEDNIRLSQRRAESVREALVGEFGIARNRLSARGVGYLSPVAPNTTPEGRRANRRVAVVVGAP